MPMKVRVKKDNLLCYAGICVLQVKIYCSSSIVFPYTNLADMILVLLGSALLFSHIILQKYLLKTFLCLSAISLLALFTYVKTGSAMVLSTVLVCFAAANQSLNKLIRYIYSCKVFLFITHIICTLVYYAAFGKGVFSGNGYTLGFIHKNLLGTFILDIMMLWAWLNYDRIRVQTVFCMLAVGFFILRLSQCRTFFVALTVFAILSLIVTYRPTRGEKLTRLTAKWSCPALFLFTLALVMGYLRGKPLSTFVDSLLSGRIRLGAYAYEHFGFTFLGQKITDWHMVWDPRLRLSGQFTFDNIFTFMAMNLGIIWFVVISISLFMTAQIGTAKDCLFITLWVIYGMTEVHGLNVLEFFPIILLTKAIGCSNQRWRALGLSESNIKQVDSS